MSQGQPKKRQRERAPHNRTRQGESESRHRQLHAFNDPGRPIAADIYRPPTAVSSPEEVLALAFAKCGSDYGGPLGARAADRAEEGARQDCSSISKT
ncbi:hypothetical protein EDE08_103518 [Bradyrhizobium sp. R2.2-H]|jgi:hypothetical protein|nr:hypothetical protein EDE10_103517 [Bradyrhizobium sp. Y-H1]TCU78066.1 hypothetical protein EDE08_103518 [Bradyrhizobium sp. R2.2-H]